MARQQIEGLEFAGRSRMTDLRVNQETGSRSGAEVYFEFCEDCRHMAAAMTRTVADAIRPPDRFFGSYARAASFTLADRRFAWVGVMAGIAGLATLLLFGWSEIGARAVSATERRADPSRLAAAPSNETQAERTEAIRRRGLELLRADIPEDEQSQSLARSDRLELQDAITKPVMRIATAGKDNSVAAPAPLPAQPAASKPAKAKEKHAVKERQARRASKHLRDRPGWHGQERAGPAGAANHLSRRTADRPGAAGGGQAVRLGQAASDRRRLGGTCGRKEMAVEIRPATRL